MPYTANLYQSWNIQPELLIFIVKSTSLQHMPPLYIEVASKITLFFGTRGNLPQSVNFLCVRMSFLTQSTWKSASCLWEQRKFLLFIVPNFILGLAKMKQMWEYLLGVFFLPSLQFKHQFPWDALPYLSTCLQVVIKPIIFSSQHFTVNCLWKFYYTLWWIMYPIFPARCELLEGKSYHHVECTE